MAESLGQRTSILGLDIGDNQWACVTLHLESSGTGVHLIEVEASAFAYDNVPDLPHDCEIAILDIPVGLLDDVDAARTAKGCSGDRSVDRGARRWCRSTSSVFPPPTRGQLETGIAEHRRASSASQKVERKRKLPNVSPGGLTQQSLELLPAIASGAKLKGRYPDRVFESHPEVVFAVLARGILPAGKMSLSGALARAAVLSESLKMDCLRWVLERESETAIGADNWLDALAMSVVALDWRVPTCRKMLYQEKGNVEVWQGQSERLMALPWSAENRPDRLSSHQVFENLVGRLALSKATKEAFGGGSATINGHQG